MNRATLGRSGSAAHDAQVDPIQASVLHRRLKSITEEMGLTLLRTTRSPILNEARDFVTGLYDARGQMLEQTEYIPVLAFALQPACEHIVAVLRRRHPRGRRHPAQRRLLGRQPEQRRRRVPAGVSRRRARRVGRLQGTPGRHRRRAGGRLQPGGARGVAGGAAHHADQGARTRRTAARRLAHDLRQHPLPHRRGGHQGADRRHARRRARHAGAVPPLRRDAASTPASTICSRSERIVRREIAAIPDGVYRGESWAFYDGVNDGSRMKIELAVTVAGDELTFDFTRLVAADAGLRQCALLGHRVGAAAHLPDADRPRRAAQRRHPAADPDRQSARARS